MNTDKNGMAFGGDAEHCGRDARTPHIAAALRGRCRVAAARLQWGCNSPIEF